VIVNRIAIVNGEGTYFLKIVSIDPIIFIQLYIY
jgi:hypothetical protein